MNRITLILATALLAWGVIACNNDGAKNKPLVGTHWRLIELNGHPVEVGKNAPEPHIGLDSATNRFNGNAGCNTFFGSYELGEAGKITFSQVAATRMMCLDMELENLFLPIFESIDGYRIKGSELTFIDVSKSPLARFTAAPTPR